MLKSLAVRNFKRFGAEMRIDFEPITVLVGANNSGKSTVLQALSILQYCIDVTRKKKNGELTLEKLTIGPEDFGALPVTSPTDLWPNGRPAAGPISIRADFDGGASVGFEIKLSYNRFSVAPSAGGDVAGIIGGSRIRYVPIHSGLALREEYLLAPARADRIRELQYGSVIRNLLWDLKENHPGRWKLLKSILARLYPAAALDVAFDRDLDRFIASRYHDHVLDRGLDVVVSGTGFQQVLQIFAGVLSQEGGMVLIDEPDAHLHARLQVELMRVFEFLTKEHAFQFVMATHSPHMLAAAPPAALRAMIEGRAHPFATTPEQVDVLDSLGAFDRMEVVPLLRNKAVVFVENRDDRDLLELFARKLWGEKKARALWDRISFLYTYQEPIVADVKRLARQVKDLLSSPGLEDLASGRPARFLVLGDRDYRPGDSLAAKRKQLLNAARSQDFRLDLQCHIWERNEIENYLLDGDAIEQAALASLDGAEKKDRVKRVVRTVLAEALAAERSQALVRIAEQIQRDDRRLTYQAVTERALAVLDAEWQDGTSLADAKRVLGAVRRALQEKALRTRVLEADVVENMSEVPEEVQRVLRAIARLSRPKARGRATRVREADRGRRAAAE